MKRINVMIVDDEPKCIDTLTSLLQYHDDVFVLASAKDMRTALPLIGKHKNHIDVLFLDIQMPGGDGFTLLQSIPEIPFKVIFTTAFDQYAIQAIRFSAIDYLLKPIDHTELSAALDRYRNDAKKAGVNELEEAFKEALLKKEMFEKLAVPTPKDILFFSPDSIQYLQSDNNYTILHFDHHKPVVSAKNIGYYEELLEGKSFMRIHNSYLVNVKKIARFVKGKSAYVELENGVSLEVSVRKRDTLLRLLQPE